MFSGRNGFRSVGWLSAVWLGLLGPGGIAAHGEPASPTLHVVFPAGGQHGTTVEVVIEGAGIEGATALLFSEPRIVCRKLAPNRFSVEIPGDLPPGTCDVRGVGPFGVSAPRAFVVGRLRELSETQPNDRPAEATPIPLDSVVNGRIEKGGDVDCYRVTAKQGQNVVVECFADRIDSQLRAVLEIRGPDGRRIAGRQESPRVDPVVEFTAPTAGDYTIELHDLSFAGSASHFYRLEVDSGPRYEYAVPTVVTAGQTTAIAIYGRNLPENPLRIDVTPATGDPLAAGLRLLPSQCDAAPLAWHIPGGQAPVLLSVAETPVTVVDRNHRSQGNPLTISPPAELSGQLVAGDEQAWFELTARRGDVYWLEAFGERLGAPVDLDLVVLDATGNEVLAQFSDALDNPGGYRLPLAHSDPAGKWVAPEDGRFLILLRNLTGGVREDPRRVYRLSVRREEPDFQLTVVSRRKDQPAALNVGPGGREMLEVLAIRRRGLQDPIRIQAVGLPDGLEAPDVWLGPGADRASLVITAGLNTPSEAARLAVVGTVDSAALRRSHRASPGSMIWAGQPLPSGRLTADLPLAMTTPAAARLTATLAQEVVSQEGALDIAVEIDRVNPRISRPVSLSAAALPAGIQPEIATIPAGARLGWISFQIPAGLPPGRYSLVIVGETECLPAGAPAEAQPVALTLVSNAVNFRVEPSRMSLGVDPRAPVRIGRGKVIQMNFFAERKLGFIGKTHVELVAPGGVVGLRGRGVTLVGQSDSGVIQIIANDDAPLGQQPFLRLEAVGTVEDKPTYKASRPLRLEIVE